MVNEAAVKKIFREVTGKRALQVRVYDGDGIEAADANRYWFVEFNGREGRDYGRIDIKEKVFERPPSQQIKRAVELQFESVINENADVAWQAGYQCGLKQGDPDPSIYAGTEEEEQYMDGFFEGIREAWSTYDEGVFDEFGMNDDIDPMDSFSNSQGLNMPPVSEAIDERNYVNRLPGDYDDEHDEPDPERINREIESRNALDEFDLEDSFFDDNEYRMGDPEYDPQYEDDMMEQLSNVEEEEREEEIKGIVASNTGYRTIAIQKIEGFEDKYAVDAIDQRGTEHNYMVSLENGGQISSMNENWEKLISKKEITEEDEVMAQQYFRESALVGDFRPESELKREAIERAIREVGGTKINQIVENGVNGDIHEYIVEYGAHPTIARVSIWKEGNQWAYGGQNLRHQDRAKQDFKMLKEDPNTITFE